MTPDWEGGREGGRESSGVGYGLRWRELESLGWDGDCDVGTARLGRRENGGSRLRRLS